MLDSDDSSSLVPRRGFLAMLSGAVVTATLAGCGDDEQPAAPTGPPVRSFTIVAQNIAWDRDAFTVPAGTEVTATIDNRDVKVEHNLHIRAPGDPKSPLEDGPSTQVLRFTIDEPGTYDFLCDAHPMMDGVIHVV